MKILCTNCGQRFDVELCGEICPYCGRKMTFDKEAYEEAKWAEMQGDDEYTLPEYDLDYVWQRPKSSWRTALIPLMVAAVLVVVIIVEASIGIYQDNHRPAGTVVQTDPLPISILAQQQHQPFAYGNQNREVTVGTAELITDSELVQRGAMLVRVFISVGKAAESEYNTDATFYLQSGDDYYAQAYEHRLIENKVAQELELLDGYALYYRSMDEGWAYFVVPEGDAPLTLWIETLQINRDTYDAESSQMIAIELTVEGAE